jgi:uncharacterized membrane protein YeiH
MNGLGVENLRAALHLIELVGVAVFAISGALMAAEKRLDPFGFVVLGAVTAIGGGTLRDLVMGVRPVFWVDQPEYLVISLAVSLPLYWLARLLRSLDRALLWSDAVGMALFTVTGTQKALGAGVPSVVAVAMGVMTAAFGGILRDVLCGEKPLLFQREIYATASLIGAGALVGLSAVGVGSAGAAAAAFTLTFAVRGAAIHYHWSIRRFGDRG